MHQTILLPWSTHHRLPATPTHSPILLEKTTPANPQGHQQPHPHTSPAIFPASNGFTTLLSRPRTSTSAICMASAKLSRALGTLAALCKTIRLRRCSTVAIASPQTSVVNSGSSISTPVSPGVNPGSGNKSTPEASSSGATLHLCSTAIWCLRSSANSFSPRSTATLSCCTSGIPTPSRSSRLINHSAPANAPIPRCVSGWNDVKNTCVTNSGVNPDRSPSLATSACSGNPGSTSSVTSPDRISVLVACPLRTPVRSPHSGLPASAPIEITRISTMPAG